LFSHAIIWPVVDLFSKESRMIQLHYKLLIGLMVLTFSNLSCQFPGYGVKSPDPTQRAGDIINSVVTQLAGDTNGFSVTITESQLNSLILQGFGDQAEAIFTNPKVDLKQGQMILSGQIKQSILAINVQVVLEPYIDERGLPKMNLVEADLGSLPVPDGMNQQLSDLFEPMILQAVSGYGQNVKLQTISVSEGEMTITGQKQ
jgi:hypothetical protein